MTWDPKQALKYMRDSAREMGPDGIRDRNDALWGSIGAMYYAWDQKVGCGTRKEFISYMRLQVGWDSDSSRDAADFVEAMAGENPPNSAAEKVPKKTAPSRFRRRSVV